MFQKHGLLLVYGAGLMSQHLAVLPASSFTSLFIQFSGYTSFSFEKRLESAEILALSMGFPICAISSVGRAPDS